VTISIGIAALGGGDTAASVLKRADQALYRAKRDGRNRVVPDAA
jgi:two-component system, cell cycle response regulator